jgi:diguanylate cyclase (GGDEF)-like protein/PAS domain S-box-containing protein
MIQLRIIILRGIMSINYTHLNQLTRDELIDKIKVDEEERKSFKYLLNSIHGISWEFDLYTDKFTYVSSGAKKILGYELDKWSDFNSWKNMLHPDDRERVAAYYQTQTQDAKDHVMEYRMLKKDGEVIWVIDVVTLTKDEKNTPTKLNGFILDITDKKIAELKVRKDHQFLQNIADSASDTIMIINADYTVSLMNKKRKEDIKERTFIDPQSPKCYEISHYRDTPCDGTQHTCPLAYVLEHKTATKVLHNHKLANGDDQYVELAASPLFDDDGNCSGIIESARDITEHINLTHELQEQSKQLRYQAHHDYLTGLPNRALFMDRLEQTIKDAKRNNNKAALFFLDLDHFKEINDTLGHDMGDQVLKEVSTRLTNNIRDNDVLSRLGGDEFTIIMKDVRTTDDITTLATKIQATFERPMISGSYLLNLSASIGICIFPDNSESSEGLLQCADSAMYQAKKLGKNTFEFYKQNA